MLVVVFVRDCDRHVCMCSRQVVWALNSEIQTTSLKGLMGDGSDVKDGERLAIVPKVRLPLCYGMCASWRLSVVCRRTLTYRRSVLSQP